MMYQIETFGNVAGEEGHNTANFQTEEEAREYGKECAKRGEMVFLRKQRFQDVPNLYDMVGLITADGKKPCMEHFYKVTADIKANCTQTPYVIHVSANSQKEAIQKARGMWRKVSYLFHIKARRMGDGEEFLYHCWKQAK